MGHEAAVTKRKVLGKVEECVEAVNDALVRVETVAEQHNAFTGELGTRFAKIDDRLHAHATWLERTETLVVSCRSAVERQLAALAQQCGKDTAAVAHQLETLDLTSGRLYAGLITHLVEIRAELSQWRAEAEAFEQLGTVRRVWWVLTGRWPRPLRPGEGLRSLVEEDPTTGAVAGVARATPFVEVKALP